jgi:hypothetical protein
MDEVKEAFDKGLIKIKYVIEIDEKFFEEKYPTWKDFTHATRHEQRNKLIKKVTEKLPTPKNFI